MFIYARPTALIRRVEDAMNKIINRVTTLLFGHKLDAVALIVVIFNLACGVGFAQAAQWLPMPHPSSPPWKEAAEVFPALAVFANAIIDPLHGVLWISVASFLVIAGILSESREFMLFGIIISLSFWSFVSMSIWVHIGFLSAFPVVAPLFSSAWVFDYVYRRQMNQIAVEQEVSESAKLVGAVTDLHEERIQLLQNAFQESLRTIQRLQSAQVNTGRG